MSFRLNIGFIFLCSWTALAVAQPVSNETIATAKQLRDEAIVGSRAWNIVESLTTEVGPRLAGSEAEARARAWAVEVSILVDLRTSEWKPSPWMVGRGAPRSLRLLRRSLRN